MGVCGIVGSERARGAYLSVRDKLDYCLVV